jgi:DNA (cytosine-5)-methyltransferase 1
MTSRQYILPLADEIVADWFAGGGGMAEAIEQAIGRHVDVSCNHDDDAISMHRANHPQSRHLVEDVRTVCARLASQWLPVGLFHMSPDCTHHSQAKGGQPRDRALRALSWVGIRWAGQVRPRIITLENVKQILQWGQLIAKRDPATGRVLKLDGTVAKPGERVPVEQQFLVPDPKRVGALWRRFVALLRGVGYVVDWRVLCAADYGVPTTRARLFMVARCDGAPIVWPEPTHFKKPASGQKRWRAAAECIDWSLASRSIFGRPRPLAEATMRRIAAGMQKYVLGSPDPFIVKFRGQSPGTSLHAPIDTITAGSGRRPAGAGHAMGLATPILVPVTHGGDRANKVSDPLRTVTTAKGGEFALAAATLVQTSYGERKGQAPRILDLQQPLGTVVAGGQKHGLVSAFLAQANAGFNEREAPSAGHDARAPLTTVTNKGSQQQLVTAHLAHLRGNCDARALDEPLRTVSAGGEHHAVVEYLLSQDHEAGALRCAAFLMRYHGSGGQWADVRDPMTTVTTHDRLALVTVWIRGEPWVIVDICLRMLEPRELYRAQGFPDTYVINRGHDGRVFSKSTQIRLCGNAVPPGLGAAVIRAQWNSRPAVREAA